MIDNAHEKNRTGVLERSSYALYFVGQNIFYMFIINFLMLFYTDYRFMAPAAVGVIFLVARVWDAVNDPLFGIIVDKSRLKWGKFKPWLAISTVLIPIACILIFAMPEGLSAAGKIAYASATYILFGMLYTVCDVPIFALVTAMTDNIQERTLLISLGRLTASIAMILISVLIMPLVAKAGWLGAALIFSAAGFLFMFPVNIFTRERFLNKEAKAPSLKDIVLYLSHNKYLLIFYTGNIIMSLTNTTLTTGNYIAKWLLGGEHMIAILMLAALLPMLVVAAFVPVITKHIDKLHFFLAGIVIMFVFSVSSYFSGYSSPSLCIFFAALRGVGFGIVNVMAFMFAADGVEYGHYKTGRRAEGITFSIQTFSTKMTAALSGAFAMICLQAIGYKGELAQQSQSTLNGIWWTSMLLPLIGFTLGFAVLFFLYKLRDKDVQIMAKINQGELQREEGEKLLSLSY
jgi:sugar (glycoside-pentoside-hexuronide) transporter